MNVNALTQKHALIFKYTQCSDPSVKDAIFVLSKEKILLIGYKNIDDNYKKYNIKITSSSDYIKVIGDFNDNDKVYLILDKFLDKQVYDINSNNNLIKPKYLEGKYSIYLKINDIIYKTDKYIEK